MSTIRGSGPYAQELMREGKFRHVWRVVGDVSNVSIFDVDTHAELHDILQNLPLFPYMDVKVTPLAEPPPACRRCTPTRPDRGGELTHPRPGPSGGPDRGCGACT